MPKVKSNTKEKRKKRLRSYDNSSREKKSEANQKAIIEALVSLLSERGGGEVPMAELAKKTGITERSIFRFFKDKKTLHEAMDQYLMSYVQASAEQLSSMDFVSFGKQAYQLFDRHEALTKAYVLSPFGQEARVLFRKKLNQAMFEKIVAERHLTLSPERKKRLAVVTSLVNAKIWYDMRTEFGLTGEDMSESIRWALKTLLDNC